MWEKTTPSTELPLDFRAGIGPLQLGDVLVLTLDHMGTPLKDSKIGLRHVLRLSKLGLEPKFNDAGAFGRFGKRGQTDRQDSCFINIDAASSRQT